MTPNDFGFLRVASLFGPRDAQGVFLSVSRLDVANYVGPGDHLHPASRTPGARRKRHPESKRRNPRDRASAILNADRGVTKPSRAARLTVGVERFAAMASRANESPCSAQARSRASGSNLMRSPPRERSVADINCLRTSTLIPPEPSANCPG